MNIEALSRAIELTREIGEHADLMTFRDWGPAHIRKESRELRSLFERLDEQISMGALSAPPVLEMVRRLAAEATYTSRGVRFCGDRYVCFVEAARKYIQRVLDARQSELDGDGDWLRIAFMAKDSRPVDELLAGVQFEAAILAPVDRKARKGTGAGRPPRVLSKEDRELIDDYYLYVKECDKRGVRPLRKPWCDQRSITTRHLKRLLDADKR